jgi:tetratricopeptide (TPR) repeat protein
MGNLAEAQTAYEQAIALDEDNPKYWRALADFSLQNGTLLREVGLNAARQAVLLAPDDPASQDMLGQVFIGLEDYLSADKFLQRALDINPAYLPAQLHLGQSALYQGKLEAGSQILKSLIAQSPDSPEASRANELLQRYIP